MEVKNSPFAHLPFIIILDGPLKCCSIFLLGACSTTVLQEKWKQNFSIFIFIIFVWEGENINLFECQHLGTVETLLLKAVLRGGNAWFFNLRSIVMLALFDKGCILRSQTIKLNCILSSLSLISVELFTKDLKVKGGKESLLYVGSSK